MERKNDSTLLILVAAGLGIYWYMKNKSNTAQVNPADQSTGGGGGAYQQPDSPLVDYNPMTDGYALYSPPNPSGGGGSADIYTDPVGRGGGKITDIFDSILDTSRNIDKDRFYEK
jgi:hypothetical protein